jgi:heat shock protein HslJ
MRPTGPGLVAACAVLLVASCGEPMQPGSDPHARVDPTGIPWELESGTIDSSDVPVVDGNPITLTIADRSASGTAACNGYGSEVSMTGNKIEFAEIMSTAMACTPDEVMDLEALYLEALPRVSEFSNTAESLTLTGSSVELNFVALPPAPIADLTGSVWVLTRLIDGDSVSNAAGDRATLELYTDGSMLGSTGCRTLHGSYTVDGAEVVMTEMSAEGECPEDLAQQDSHVVTVLGDGFRAVVDDRTLTLTSLGEQGLVYRDEG